MFHDGTEIWYQPTINYSTYVHLKVLRIRVSINSITMVCAPTIFTMLKIQNIIMPSFNILNIVISKNQKKA